MPVHDGARSTLKFIRERNRVLVITARKGAAIEWTADWLRRNRLPFDEFVGGAQVNKSVHATDVLIDDYLGNIIEFLENTPGVAVLVDQPWNRQRQTLEPFLTSGRAFVVSNLPELSIRWPQISGRCLERKAATNQTPGSPGW
jgi:5'(3')-deoxyribonucleotidase